VAKLERLPSLVIGFVAPLVDALEADPQIRHPSAGHGDDHMAEMWVAIPARSCGGI
jgi:hypothetical protein